MIYRSPWLKRKLNDIVVPYWSLSVYCIAIFFLLNENPVNLFRIIKPFYIFVKKKNVIQSLINYEERSASKNLRIEYSFILRSFFGNISLLWKLERKILSPVSVQFFFAVRNGKLFRLLIGHKVVCTLFEIYIIKIRKDTIRI